MFADSATANSKRKARTYTTFKLRYYHADITMTQRHMMMSLLATRMKMQMRSRTIRKRENPPGGPLGAGSLGEVKGDGETTDVC